MVIDTTRRMLNAVELAELANEPVNPVSAEALGPLRVMRDILASPGWNAMTQYQAIAMLSAALVWAGRETGRPPGAILDELARNFESPD